MLNKKGFTLIELLVVIAVLGILASVVLVAINPGERIAEAKDSGTKNGVGQVATALEAFYTAQNGAYKTTAATPAVPTVTDLVTYGYLKQAPVGVSIVGKATFDYAVVVSSAMTATSNKKKAPAGTAAYWVYATFNGKTYACDAAPTGDTNFNATESPTAGWVDGVPTGTCTDVTT